MSQISSKHKKKPIKGFGDHQRFFTRIKKTLYYGRLPKTDRFSLPVTELTAELFSQAKIGNSLERLHLNDAAKITRNACVSPCSLVLAMLYLDRLKTFNPAYLQSVAPSELFLVSLMVSSKFLYDDGEDDEVFMDEWATSGGISLKQLIQLEKDFLKAIKWEIYVSEITFWKKLKTLELMLAKKEGFSRGWFTYSELDTMVDNLHFQNVIQVVASLFAILLATYTAGLLTILGSMFIVSHIPGNCLQNKWNQIDNNKTSSLAVFNDINENIIDDSTIHANSNEQTYKKTLHAIDVLQTSIILASIKSHKDGISNNKTKLSPVDDDANDNVEYITWNWWNSPTMEWLTKTSKLMEQLDFLPRYNFNSYNYEIYNMNNKRIELQDQVHKASSVRIQDQMEMSWHKEWTDTIKRNFLDYNLFHYFQDIIS